MVRAVRCDGALQAAVREVHVAALADSAVVTFAVLPVAFRASWALPLVSTLARTIPDDASHFFRVVAAVARDLTLLHTVGIVHESRCASSAVVVLTVVGWACVTCRTAPLMAASANATIVYVATDFRCVAVAVDAAAASFGALWVTALVAERAQVAIIAAVVAWRARCAVRLSRPLVAAIASAIWLEP